MAYELRALVCAPHLSAGLAARLNVSTAVLTGELTLVPLPGRRDSEAREESTSGDPMLYLTPQVEAAAAEASASGTVAYVEAEYFGGVGTQAAAAWHDGALVFGPVTSEHTAGQATSGVTANLPINAALRRAGVVADSRGEFDAAGLGRHRSTVAWLGEDRD